MTRRTTLDNHSLYFDHGIWLPDKTLDLTGDIEEFVTFRAMKGLKILDDQPDQLPITIRLSTVGGELYDGLAIYDAIRACRSRVEIIGYGKIMSMGAVILQAADPEGRLLMPNATILVHQGYSGITMDHPETVQRFAKEDKRIRAKINRILYERSKISGSTLTQKQFIEQIQFDTWMSPETTIAHGLADRVLSA